MQPIPLAEWIFKKQPVWAFQDYPPANPFLTAGLFIVAGLLAGVLLGWVGHVVINRGQQKNRIKQAVQRETERVSFTERERMLKLFNQISALTSTLNYQRVLDNALDQASFILSAGNNNRDKVVSAVMLFTQSDQGHPQLSIGSARRLTPTDTRTTLPGISGLIGETIDSGEAVFTIDMSGDPELCRLVGMRACKSAYCIPLRAGLDTYGVLTFAHPEADYFDADRREILKLLGSQAVIAIANARLYNDLEMEKERMIEVQEETRKKLARDLHDGPTQSVAAIAMRVNFARRLLERDSKSTSEELFKIEELARRTTKEIRHMLFTLRPLVLESQGLVAALQATGEKMLETYNQKVVLEADQGLIDQMEMGKQAVVFFIAEEAMNNARKHAQAQHIWVRIKTLRSEIGILEIEDDGVGFNVGAVDAVYATRGSLGMVNMRERAELINGLLNIDSAEGRGTRIRIVFPLSEEAADRLRRGL